MNSSATLLLSQSDLPFEASPSSIAQEPRRTLLIVDDEDGPRKSIRAVFKNQYDVLMAEGGVQALDLARNHPVDAAVLDIRMTDMSGIELLEKLKQLDPAMEIIMLTAFETLETARQALRLGAADYLDKPFDVSTIRGAVSNAMARRSLSQEIDRNRKRLLDLEEEVHDQKLREEIARTKGDIYASMIHDLNSPLTVISGFVEMINKKIPSVEREEGQTMAQVRAHLSEITRQIDKSIDISRRYLSLIRRRMAESCRVSVNQILNELGELLKFHPDARNNQVILHHLPEDALAAINGIDLIQILLNLSNNALQCTDKPHLLEIRGQRVTGALDLAAFQEDSENRVLNRDGFDPTAQLVAITVRDDGPGIHPDVLGKMFASYFTTKSAGKGTGLGLSIVLRFIKEARGLVHVHTKVGHGTSFTVYLPAF